MVLGRGEALLLSCAPQTLIMLLPFLSVLHDLLARMQVEKLTNRARWGEKARFKPHYSRKPDHLCTRTYHLRFRGSRNVKSIPITAIRCAQSANMRPLSVSCRQQHLPAPPPAMMLFRLATIQYRHQHKCMQTVRRKSYLQNHS